MKSLIHRLKLKLILLLLLPLAAPVLAEEPVIAVGPEFKIDPVTGTVIGERQTVQYLRQNSNLLNEQGDIELSVFPGETAAFQFITPPDPELRIDIENRPGLAIRLYQVGVVTVPKAGDKYFPDVLIPLPETASGGQFFLPNDRELIPRHSGYYVFWVEIPITDEIQGKSLTTKLRLKGAEFEQTLAIKLTVAGSVLPPPPLWLDFNEYGDKYLYPFQGDYPGTEIWKIEEEVFRMGREHHGIVNPLPYKSQKGEAREGMAPKILNGDLLNPNLDWFDYDARFGKYFDGSAFADGQPLRHFYLPFNPNWPAPFELYNSDREKYEQIWAVFAREFIKHFTEKGWTQTIFQVYCNQKPNKENKIPWNLDEPKGVDDYKALRYYTDLSHKVFANSGPVNIRFRIDISHFYCDDHKGNRDKDFRVNGGGEILEPVDIWVISDHSLAGNYAMQKAKELMAAGKEVWIYSETPLIIEDGKRAFERIYRARENGLTGFMAWKSFTRDLHDSKGADFLFYTISAGGKKGIYPSIRLKQLRRAIDEARISDLEKS